MSGARWKIFRKAINPRFVAALRADLRHLTDEVIVRCERSGPDGLVVDEWAFVDPATLKSALGCVGRRTLRRLASAHSQRGVAA